MKWIRQKYMYFYKKSTYEMDTYEMDTYEMDTYEIVENFTFYFFQ
jgi:hypothetical protein